MLAVSITLLFVDWPILDPILSIVFTLFILINVLRNLKQTVTLFLQAIPNKALADKIKITLQNIEGIADYHDFHLWSLDGEHHVLTVHAVLEHNADIASQRAIKQRIQQALAPFHLEHTTIELEFADEQCREGHNK